MNSMLLRTCLALLAVSLLPQLAYGQSNETEASVPQVGFVEVSRIYRESEYVANRQTEVNDEFKDREATLRSKSEEFNLLLGERTSLSQDASLSEEIASKASALEREIKRESRDLTEDKRVRFDEVKREVDAQVIEMIKKVASERELYFVYELSTVLFAEKRLDITDAVIGALDTQPATTDTASDN